MKEKNELLKTKEHPPVRQAANMTGCGRSVRGEEMLCRSNTEADVDEAFFAANTQGMDVDLAAFYQKWVPSVQKGIKEFFPGYQSGEFLRQTLGIVADDADIDAIHDAVVEPTFLYINRPGKLLRPILTALILDAYGGDISRYCRVLSMIEVMEVTTISINDIFDESLYRRGGYCTHIQYDRSTALAAGMAGYAYCLSFLFNNHHNFDRETALRLHRAFAFEDIQLWLGDVVESCWPVFKKNVIEEPHYFQELASRCAFLSFRGPARIGAILGGAPDEEIRHFEAFGMLIGLAYHLRGDNLNASPKSTSWGKVAFEDITAGRRSLLTSSAYRQASPGHKKEMENILDSHTTDQGRIDRFIELIRLYHAPEYCESRAVRFLDEAKQHLENTDIPHGHKETLAAFADFMVKRNK